MWLVAAGGLKHAQFCVQFVELRGDVVGGADFGGGKCGGGGEFGSVEVAAQLVALSSRAQRSSASSRVAAYAVSSCTTTTPVRTWGQGEPIRGPGVAVMLAVCGRTVAFDRLTGSGLPVLESRSEPFRV